VSLKVQLATQPAATKAAFEAFIDVRQVVRAWSAVLPLLSISLSMHVVMTWVSHEAEQATVLAAGVVHRVAVLNVVLQ
jgi:hypothetical protein